MIVPIDLLLLLFLLIVCSCGVVGEGPLGSHRLDRRL